MNQMVVVLRILIQVAGILELATAMLVWLLGWKNRSNRYLGWLLTLLAFENFFLGQVMVAADIAQAEPWLCALAVTTLTIFPSTFVGTLSLLRPATWEQKWWERWLWRLVHVLVFIPFVLIFSDVLFNTHWLYDSPDPQAYQGGFIHADYYLQGAFAPFLRWMGSTLIIVPAILLTTYTLLFDHQVTPRIQRRARWLLIAQLAVALIQGGLQLWLDDLLLVVLTNLILAVFYAIAFLQDLLSGVRLRQLLANTPLRVKLYIGLGTSIAGLLIIAGITSYTSVVNQQLVNRTLTRQRQLADRAAEINNNLLTIQNQAFEFYDTWTSTGFETGTGGFEEARRIYLTPLQEQIEQIQEAITEIERLETDEQARTNLARVRDNMDAYETTLLQMSGHMENLGFIESGAVGQMRTAMAELTGRLGEPGLESLKATALELRRHEKNFFLHSDLVSARLAQDFIRQLTEQIAAAADDQLAPEDKAQLNALLEGYRDLFLVAANHLSLVDINRETLINQSDLTSALVSNLFEQQQAEFAATAEELERRQSNITFTVIGLALPIFLVSVLVVYAVAGQIIQPVQMLGEAARRLGAGELDVRATIHGLDEIGATAAAFNLMADQLQEVLAGLEQRVAERTRGLQAAAEVGRATTSVLDPGVLLQQVVDLVRERFDLYHVDLALLDEERRFAVLRAATGEAGHQLLEEGLSLEVGGNSMIGWCTAHAQPRVAPDVTQDTMYSSHPLLPDTRSAATIPLIARGRVIGALNVESAKVAAFDEAAVAVLQTMTDQVAVAIDNAQLFADTQAALEETEATHRHYLGQAWAEFVPTRAISGYAQTDAGTVPLGNGLLPEVQQAMMEQRRVIWRSDENEGQEEGVAPSALAVPITLRGQSIGVLGFKEEGRRQWSEDDVALAEALAEQFALAADNLRLLDETQRSAARERLIGEVTARMRETLDMDTVLQTTIREFGKILDVAEVEVRMSSGVKTEG
jgi:GAF domain-containing protein/methyl-accepting chemotaxis protein